MDMAKHKYAFAVLAAFALAVNRGAADVNYIWANTSSDMNSASSYFLSDGTTVSTAVQARTPNHGSIISFSFPSVHRPLTGAFAPRTVHGRAERLPQRCAERPILAMLGCYESIQSGKIAKVGGLFRKARR